MFNLVIILLSTINSEPKDSNNYKIAKHIILTKTMKQI